MAKSSLPLPHERQVAQWKPYRNGVGEGGALAAAADGDPRFAAEASRGPALKDGCVSRTPTCARGVGGSSRRDSGEGCESVRGEERGSHTTPQDAALWRARRVCVPVCESVCHSAIEFGFRAYQ